jgi:hypothetical protein
MKRSFYGRGGNSSAAGGDALLRAGPAYDASGGGQALHRLAGGNITLAGLCVAVQPGLALC